jgi:hypothetical protein
LVSRFALAFLLAFELFELRFVGFFSVFVFEFDDVFEDELLSCLSVVCVFELEGGEYWPSGEPRLMSTATVWPTFTTSPACGS